MSDEFSSTIVIGEEENKLVIINDKEQPENKKDEYQKFTTSSFDNMSIGTFFYYNSFLCIKMNNRQYLRINYNMGETTIVEWDKQDFKDAHICDMLFKYQVIQK